MGVMRGWVPGLGLLDLLPEPAGFLEGDNRCWLFHPPLWPGYHGEGFGDILLFAACHLPDNSIPQYGYVMENLLRWGPERAGNLPHAPCFSFPKLTGRAVPPGTLCAPWRGWWPTATSWCA